ncbi:MAG: HD domain-containing protein [Lachnospiraceae bacterium]|nr:HD domain-containing protein [Lachnospiraceae bacterium]
MALFDMILDKCIDFTDADGGSLYIEAEGSLKHLLDINRTLDADSKKSSIEADKIAAGPDDTDIFTYCYHNPENLLNIPDIYLDERFDITEIKKFDEENDYRTQSVLMIPILEPDQSVLGVMMLYNCLDNERNIIPFSSDYEKLVKSLTAQMANTLTSMILIQDQEELLESFVECMTTAIDARTPYNGKHTKHVARYCQAITDYMNVLYTRDAIDRYITPNEQEQLLLAAKLHDIGKMITPREILNKATRLGEKYSDLRNKLEKIRLRIKIDMLEHKMQIELWQEEDELLGKFLDQLDTLNTSGFLTDEQIAFIDQMGEKFYEDFDGTITPYLDENEKHSLHIRKGTLTEEEREIVKRHVTYTAQMLSKINFYDKYDRVVAIASNHHEYIDGSGYPRGLKDGQLDLLTRIMTVCDIFDSLTADDRPYKKKLTLHKALSILNEMGKEGKLDSGIVLIVNDYMSKHFDELSAQMKEEELREKEEEERSYFDFQADGKRMEEQERAIRDEAIPDDEVGITVTEELLDIDIPFSGISSADKQLDKKPEKDDVIGRTLAPSGQEKKKEKSESKELQAGDKSKAANNDGEAEGKENQKRRTAESVNEEIRARNEELERTKAEEVGKSVVMDEIPRSGKPRSRKGKKSKGTGTTLDLEATKDNESAGNTVKDKQEEEKQSTPVAPMNDGLENLPFLDDRLLDLEDDKEEDPNPFARHRAAEVLPSAGNPMLAGRAGEN